MDKQISSEIPDESFLKCGQYIYERDISYTYFLIEKNKLETQHEYLMSELYLVNDDINHLKSNIDEFNSKGYFNNQYSINFFKIKQTVKKLKEKIINKENERKFLLLDIETTERHMKEVMCKIADYFHE